MYRETGLASASPQSQQDDATLLALVRRGDEHAMGVLFDRYAKVVYSVALRTLRDPESAEEMLPEVFLPIWRNPERFSPVRKNLGGWLAILARNLSINALRRKRPVDPVEEIALPIDYDLANDGERNAVMERARGVVFRLPVEQRKTLEMAFFDGLTHSEIAEMTADPPAAVKTRIRSALGALRKAFQS
jgi:RNA polymerase sigma-70 factor, ECF subfamily